MNELSGRTLTVWGVFGVERPEHAAVRRARHRRIVDRVNECGYAKYVGEQDELLAQGRACLANTREELDGLHPFLTGQAGCR